MQRVRIRYAKRGRLRFVSHRDFARALERALRRAAVPVAHSAGFHPHPRISYLGAAPTGAASEAEYLELGLAAKVDPRRLREVLDAALPTGLDVLGCVEVSAADPPLADLIDASLWRIELPGVAPERLSAAVGEFLAADVVEVERRIKDGRRTVDARGQVVSATVVVNEPGGLAAGQGGRTMPSEPEGLAPAPTGVPRPTTPKDHDREMPAELGLGASVRRSDRHCAILEVVVRQGTPAVRPDDVLAALRAVADLAQPAAARATRLAQGRLDGAGRIADPLVAGDPAVLPGTEERPVDAAGP